MKKRLLGIIAIVLLFGIAFGGLGIWKYLDSQSTFAADGYILTGSSQAETIAASYFTAGTAYQSNYGNELVYKNSLGSRESVPAESFIHYTDGSISALAGGMTTDLDEVDDGILDFYYLAPRLVMTNGGAGYSIDNNDASLEFTNFLWLLTEDKFLVQAGGGMTLTMANGTEQEIADGYLEILFPEENIVRISCEDAVWQSVASGSKITLNNGTVIDLGNRIIYDSRGEARYTIHDVAMDLASGSGIAVQSDSAANWVPPTFEFQVIDGQDGTDGTEGEAGEEGQAGEEGEEGEEGQEGQQGQQGQQGEPGVTGEPGGNGGSSGTVGGGGAGGGGELGSALGQVIISSLEYDCSQVTFSFYAENEAGAMQPTNNYVELIETATGRVVKTMVYGEYEGFDSSIPESDINTPITLTADGLSPDTEYKLLIYSDYQVESSGVKGTKAFASRTFYTASEGVQMAVDALDQTSVQIRLDKKSFSTVQTARVKVTFEGADSEGNRRDYVCWSDVLDLSRGGTLCSFQVVQDGETESMVGLTSNIPFAVTLYTSDLPAAESANAWSVSGTTADGWAEEGAELEEPNGLNMDPAAVNKSGQLLSGRTLKAVPTAGELKYQQSGQGYYSVYLNAIQDPDASIQNYEFKFYEQKDNGGTPTLTLVRTMSTTSSRGIELFVDEETIDYNKTYIVECTVSYNDNEKDYTLQVGGVLEIGRGEAVVYFQPADNYLELPADKQAALPGNVQRFGPVGPTWLYGCLVVDVEGSGFQVDQTQQIMVNMTTGSDYIKTLYYEPSADVTDQNYFYEADGNGSQYIYSTDKKKLYIPLNVWGLKEESYYSFQVSAYVNLSDATSTYRNVGTAVYGTASYNGTAGTANLLSFQVTDLTDEMGAFPEMTFGIDLKNDWEDRNYPIEVLSARAIELTASDGNGVPINTYVIDLYDTYQYSAPADDKIWHQADQSPLARYLNGSADVGVATDNNGGRTLLTFDKGLFGDSAQYSAVRLEVTGVYDYTYSESSYFPEAGSCNVSGYANELGFESNSDIHEIGAVRPPLPDDREGAATAIPIINSANATGTAVSILGDGLTVDPALESSTVRGYRVNADFISSEMDTVTYYLFTYDDWADYNKCSAEGTNETRDYADIIQAALTAEEDGTKAQYWKDKVISIELDLEQYQYNNTRAPGVDVIGTTDAAKIGKLEYSGGTFIYYTDRLQRGQTYVMAYTVLDGYTKDADGNATYLYPYNDPGYAPSNQSILRTVPLQMNRQSPQVKLNLDYTSIEGREHWSFSVYDPDQALGHIDPDSHELTTWTKLYQEGRTGAVDWKDGYLMSSTYTIAGSGGVGPLMDYISNGYSLENASINFPEVELVELQPMTAAEAAAGFSPFRKGTGSSDVDLEATGAAWKGSFAVDMRLQTEGIHYLFLGRSINDSAYLTNAIDAALNPGLGLTAPTLYTMAGAQRRHDRIYSSEQISNMDNTGSVVFIGSLDSNNLLFQMNSGASAQIRERITGLEVTVWQATDEHATSYQLLDTQTVAFNAEASDGYVARLSLGNLPGYMPNYRAYARVRIIYDTGLYGTQQSVYMKNQLSTATNNSLTADLGDGQLINYVIWEQAGGLYPYSIREQNAKTWYTTSTSTRLSATKTAVSGSVWKVSEESFSNGTNSGSMKVQRVDYTGLEGAMASTRLTMTGSIADGSSQWENTGYLAAAVGGWNESLYTKRNLLLGSFAVTNGVFQEEAGSSVETNDTQVALQLADGSTEVLEPNQAVSFVMPRTTIATVNKTTMTTTYNKVDVEFGLDVESYERLGGGGSSKQSHLPYVFVEIYKDTVLSTSATSVAGSGYYISSKGTLIDSSYTGDGYLTGPRSHYNDMWGAAGNYTAGTDAERLVLGDLGAIPVDRLTASTTAGYRTTFTVSNLKAGTASSYTNYSVRLFVLPRLDTEGRAITYDSSDKVQQYKEYIMDNAQGSGYSRYLSGFHYYTSAREVWWRLRTDAPAGINSNMSASYSATGYTTKNITVNVSLTSSKNAALEYRLKDSDGNVVLDNTAMMAIAGNSGYPDIRPATYVYYDQDGNRQTATYRGYYNGSTAYGISGSQTFKAADYLNRGILKLGETYTIEARVVHLDPTLTMGANAALFTTGANDWVTVSDSYSDTPVVLKKAADSTPASRSVNLTLPTGLPAVLTASSDFQSNSSAGMDMTIGGSVADTSYRVGVFKAGEDNAVSGQYYVKVFGNAYTDQSGASQPGGVEVSDKFQTRTGSGYQYYTTGSVKNWIYQRNEEFDRSYYLEIWGTYDGTRHEQGQCSCGKIHNPDEVENGNICILSSKNDANITNKLTMPNSSGIRIQSVSLTYNKSSRTVNIKMEAGVGYTNLKSAIITLNQAGKVFTASGAITWSSSKQCSLTFTDTAANQISGYWEYTIYFYDADGNSYQVAGAQNL